MCSGLFRKSFGPDAEKAIYMTWLFHVAKGILQTGAARHALLEQAPRMATRAATRYTSGFAAARSAFIYSELAELIAT
jgi:hypothetical protein